MQGARNMHIQPGQPGDSRLDAVGHDLGWRDLWEAVVEVRIW